MLRLPPRVPRCRSPPARPRAAPFPAARRGRVHPAGLVLRGDDVTRGRPGPPGRGQWSGASRGLADPFVPPRLVVLLVVAAGMVDGDQLAGDLLPVARVPPGTSKVAMYTFHREPARRTQHGALGAGTGSARRPGRRRARRRSPRIARAWCPDPACRGSRTPRPPAGSSRPAPAGPRTGSRPASQAGSSGRVLGLADRLGPHDRAGRSRPAPRPGELARSPSRSPPRGCPPPRSAARRSGWCRSRWQSRCWPRRRRPARRPPRGSAPGHPRPRRPRSTSPRTPSSS